MTTTAPPRSQQLSEGELGTVLLHIERGDTDAAHTGLARAVAGGVSTGANASLFHGTPALEFVLGRAGHTRPDVREAVDRVVTARLATAHRRRADGVLPYLAEFDLIGGLTGLGALLLARDETSPLLKEVLAYLVSLAQPVRVNGRELPGWWSALSPHGEQKGGGHGNNGVAHGIAGPLALLSLATRHGVRVPGQDEAIGVFACWLDSHACGYWTTRDQLDAPQPPAPAPARPSWCYGRPGIARAHHLAGLALGDRARSLEAEDTLVRTLTDPTDLGRITDASLCHGWAGLVALTRAVAADSPTPQRFTPLIDDLTARLAATVDHLPKPGFMEGRAGAHLALAGTDATGWTRALLIT
ncbi:lanthionine synthetase C family protein [Nocardiopsis sp. LOL_012]|uniref:lanthionine synthetase C family protein n=1 Tax=Nocardiopsis sp. LOL_012 TaxID=3345409 RepID=UPI003A8B6ABC